LAQGVLTKGSLPFESPIFISHSTHKRQQRGYLLPPPPHAIHTYVL